MRPVSPVGRGTLLKESDNMCSVFREPVSSSLFFSNSLKANSVAKVNSFQEHGWK